VWVESGGSQHSRPSQVHKQCLTAPFTVFTCNNGAYETLSLLQGDAGGRQSPPSAGESRNCWWSSAANLAGRRCARPEALAGRCGRPSSPAGVDLAPSPWRASAAGLARRARSESPAGKNGRPCSPASSAPRVPGWQALSALLAGVAPCPRRQSRPA
jgi:hypothetical protein